MRSVNWPVGPGHPGSWQESFGDAVGSRPGPSVRAAAGCSGSAVGRGLPAGTPKDSRGLLVVWLPFRGLSEWGRLAEGHVRRMQGATPLFVTGVADDVACHFQGKKFDLFFETIIGSSCHLCYVAISIVFVPCW